MVMCVAEPASVYRDASEELSAFAGFGPVISTAGIIVFSFIVQVSHTNAQFPADVGGVVKPVKQFSVGWVVVQMQVPTIFLEVRDPGSKRGEPAGGADGAGSIYGGEEEEGDGEHHRATACKRLV